MDYSGDTLLAIAGNDLHTALVVGGSIAALILVIFCLKVMSRPVPGYDPPPEEPESVSDQFETVLSDRLHVSPGGRTAATPGFVLPLPHEAVPGSVAPAGAPQAQPWSSPAERSTSLPPLPRTTEPAEGRLATDAPAEVEIEPAGFPPVPEAASDGAPDHAARFEPVQSTLNAPPEITAEPIAEVTGTPPSDTVPTPGPPAPVLVTAPSGPPLVDDDMAQQAAPLYRTVLVFRNGARTDDEIPIDEYEGDEFAIGRSDVPENQIVIREDLKVSRVRHAIIVRTSAGRYSIRDNKSANRLHVNGRCTEDATVALTNGDRIQIGLTEFELVQRRIS